MLGQTRRSLPNNRLIPDTTCETGNIGRGHPQGDGRACASGPLGTLSSSSALPVSSPTGRSQSQFTCSWSGLVSSDEFVAHDFSATSNGAKMPRANWDVLQELPIAMPSPELLGRFNEHMRALIAEQQNLVFQSRNLRKTRDVLLPRLLSGQLSVEGAA
jgi:hypothetical protein